MVSGQMVNLPEVSMSGSRAHKHWLATRWPRIRTLFLHDVHLDYLFENWKTSRTRWWPGTRPQLNSGSLLLLGLIGRVCLKRKRSITKSKVSDLNRLDDARSQFRRWYLDTVRLKSKRRITKRAINGLIFQSLTYQDLNWLLNVLGQVWKGRLAFLDSDLNGLDDALSQVRRWYLDTVDTVQGRRW